MRVHNGWGELPTSFTVTDRKMNMLFGVMVAVNPASLALSRAYWPSLPGFPSLIDKRPALSLLVETGLVVVGAVIQFSSVTLRKKAGRE